MDDREIRRRMDDAMQRMINAGWIADGRFDPRAPGYQVVWTVDGALEAMKLKHWYHLLRMQHSDDWPQLAHELANGQRLGVGGKIAGAGEELVRAGLAASVATAPDGELLVAWTPAGMAWRADLVETCRALRLPDDPDAILFAFLFADANAPDDTTTLLL